MVWTAGGNQGGYAEYIALPERNVITIPSQVTGEDTEGAFSTGMTALSFVKEVFPVQKGQAVIVHAATLTLVDAGSAGSRICPNNKTSLRIGEK